MMTDDMTKPVADTVEVDTLDVEVPAVPVAPVAAAPEVDWKDRALRAVADLDNYRKRAAAELADAKAYAVTSFARDLLPVADNFARALSTPEGNEAALREGVKMVADQLAGVLAKHGVTPVEVAAGSALNPEVHQVMVQVPGTGHAPGALVAELQAGYTLNGRLLRAAMVSVASAE